MVSRSIFGKNNGILQQGCLFNGAIADGYQDCDVHGLIITPRCDIAQRKVSTIHYLPVVRLEDWKSRFLVDELREAEGGKIRKRVKDVLERNNLLHLLDPRFRLNKDSLEAIGKSALGQDCINDLLRWWSLFDAEKCESLLLTGERYKSQIANLADGKMERYLLIENWEKKAQYYVICLTEINRLELAVAEELVNGILARDVNFEKNDLYADDNLLRQYRIVGSVVSPYIEYVCQKFSNAFFRIGIEDWPSRDRVISL